MTQRSCPETDNDNHFLFTFSMNSQVLWTSLSHSHASYYFSRLKCSAYGILLMLFHSLVIFIGLTAPPVLLNSLTWAGEATHWRCHTYVHPSVHTHTQKHTQSNLLCFALLSSFLNSLFLSHYVHFNTLTLPFFISLFEYYFSAYAGGPYI